METSKHGRPQTFFLGRAKIFQGARIYFMPLKQQKRYYFSLKTLKTYYFTRGARAPPCNPLRTPMHLNIILPEKNFRQTKGLQKIY
jgi:hypothetical protein